VRADTVSARIRSFDFPRPFPCFSLVDVTRDSSRLYHKTLILRHPPKSHPQAGTDTHTPRAPIITCSQHPAGSAHSPLPLIKVTSASMANTTNPSQQSCTSPSDRESSHVQDSTSSRPVSLSPALEGAPKATRLTLKEYTARKKQQAAAPKARITLKEYTARKKQQAAAPQASTYKSARSTIPPFDTDNNLVQHYDASMERCPRRSLLFHRKNNRLESASRTATRISTPRSTVKDELLLSATTTATPITASGSALENYMRLLDPTKTPNPFLKNDMLVPTRRETSTRTLEIEDAVLIPTTTIATPVVISDSSHLLFRL
jgi:hypothetical protein